MQKKYVARLTEEERASLTQVVKKLSGTSQKVRRAQILLKADADGPAWTDARIAEAFDCRTKTVENVRERFVTAGFQETLDGKQEAKLIAMRLGSPPKGYGGWTLRLLARKLVERKVVASISHETVRRTLKKTA